MQAAKKENTTVYLIGLNMLKISLIFSKIKKLYPS